jgi:hypothetical protein
MKVIDWMIAAKDEENEPVLYWDGERWVKDSELGKSYYQETEARSLIGRMPVPEGAVLIGLVKYEADVKE